MLLRNHDFIRKIIITKSFRIYLWFSGSFILFFTMLFYYFISRYGSFLQIPVRIRIIMISAGILILILIGLVKLFIMEHDIDPKLSVFKMAQKTMGGQLIRLFSIVGVLAVYFSAYFSLSGSIQMIFPVIAIAAGLLYVMIGILYSLNEFLIPGIIFIVPGASSILFINSSPIDTLVWAGSTFGLSIFTMGFIIEIVNKINKTKKVRK